MKTLLERCQHLPDRTFAPGECLLEEGSRTGVIYVLVEGELEVLKGQVQIATSSEPGALFGEMSVLLDLPHMATVKAVEPSIVKAVAQGREFLRAQPDVTVEVARMLARRLHFVTTYLADLKRQFEGTNDHLGMVDEVLDSLVHHQD